MSSSTMSSSKKYAVDFLSFVNASPTPFHAVESAKQRLLKAGFSEIRERNSWASSVKLGGRYFLTRNGSSIVAFGVGKKWKPGNGMAMIGAHTDSPALRVKPISKKGAEGYTQVGVECYGGGIWHTWFDRDLALAGRAMVRGPNGSFISKLIRVERPILRIPTLAIHLERQDTFTPNKETQILPIAGLVAAELNKTAKADETKEETKKETPFSPLALLTERHHPAIVSLIAKEANVAVEDVVDFETILYDMQPACLGGLNDEFIFSGRLDNLVSTYCSTIALIESFGGTTLDNESGIRLISLFDHEEIGSKTAQGADSNLLPAVVTRLSVLTGLGEVVTSSSEYSVTEQSMIKSMLWSCDQAHSVHPNYPQKYEGSHRPEMNKGTVIKINANARYATNSPGIALTEEVARRAGVPLQLFVVRNDSSCGSTIGPMLSAKLGIRTVDMGNSQLSMHSIRETGGSDDVEHLVRLMKGYLEHFSELEPTIMVDAVDHQEENVEPPPSAGGEPPFSPWTEVERRESAPRK